MPKYIVRYGSMRALGVLNTRGADRFGRGARVIARTNRGLETGEVLTEATDDAVARLRDPASGQILREMTADDENELAHIESKLGREFEACQKHVKELKLQMDLVDIEHVFGGERIVVYYLAEQRVDFRELVKRLASEFQTRIEMRQIGVRDEAKLLADYGDCGKPVCCNTHLSAMPPVSMKMAKLQKATLDPTKISGRCGRLKCCLRYEYDTYEELQRELPPVGSDIVTAHGNARVLSQEVLSQQLLIQGEDNRRMVIDANEVLTIVRRGSGKRGRPKRRESDDSSGTEQPAKSDKPERSRGRGDGKPREERGEAKSAAEGKSSGGRGTQRRGRGGKRSGRDDQTGSDAATETKSSDVTPAPAASSQSADADATAEPLAAPENTAPENTAPENAAPENAAPTGTPPDAQPETPPNDNRPSETASDAPSSGIARDASAASDPPATEPDAEQPKQSGEKPDSEKRGRSRRRRSRRPKRPDK